MKFSCSREALSDALSSVSRAIPTHATLDVLKGILIETGENALTVTGNDTKLAIVTHIPAEIKEPGTCVLDARMFLDIVRRLPSDDVSVDISAQYAVTILSGFSHFAIQAMPSDKYPSLPEVFGLRKLTLKQAALKRQLSMTTFAVSQSDTKGVFTGVCFDAEPGVLTLVALDGHRMAVARKEAAVADTFTFIVPAQPLQEVERLLSASESAETTLHIGSRHILFDIGETTVVSRLVEGEFFKYKNSIPALFSLTLSVNTQELSSSLERVSLLISDKLKNPVRLSFAPTEIRLSCVTGLGNAADTCPCECDGTLEMGFNHRYLLDALRHTPDEQVRIQSGGALAALVFTPPEGDEYLFLVLPVDMRGR